MALLTTQVITSAGLAPTLVAATSGGDTIAPASSADDRTFLYVNNAAGSPITVTIADPGKTQAGNAGTAPAISVAAGAIGLIPINPGEVSQSTGLASITYSSATSVTVASIRR